MKIMTGKRNIKGYESKDRRKGSDWLIKTMNALTILACTVLFTGFIISHYGRPETSNIIIRFHDIEIRDYWIPHLKQWFVLSLGYSSFISILALFINNFRMKRKSDNFRYSLFFFPIVSIIIFLNIC
jgi:hypothetical protein